MTTESKGLTLQGLLTFASPGEVAWVATVLKSLAESALASDGSPSVPLAEVRFWPETRRINPEGPFGGGSAAVLELAKFLQGLMCSDLGPHVPGNVQTRLRVSYNCLLETLVPYVQLPALQQSHQPLPYLPLATASKYTRYSSASLSPLQTVSIVVPAAGRSSRFPNMKPKWMLTQPNGRLMLVDALSTLDFTHVSAVYVGLLREHIDAYCGGDPEAVLSAFADGVPALQNISIHLVVIPRETSDQVETVEWIINSGKVAGAIFLKDCDNQFTCAVEPVNGVATLDINRANEEVVYNIASKGFVSTDGSRIVNMVEKRMISNQICIGAYAFSSVEEVQAVIHTCRQVIKNASAKVELAVSDLYWKLLLDGKPIRALFATNYLDWGTLAAWQRYCKSFKTVFVDIDGTLVKNSGQYFQPQWGTTGALTANVAFLREMHDTGRVKVILTTSRTEAFREVTLQQLRVAQCPFDQIIFGLQHAQRVVINDFAPTNPFPSALAVNLSRNDDNLRQLLG